MAGLAVIGRDRYGVFPLRGKMLNVRDANYKQINENAEVLNLLKILGLQYKLKYDNEAELKTLRYGKIMIMADQDQDGSHIKGLLINFIHHSWPNLMKKNFVEASLGWVGWNPVNCNEYHHHLLGVHHSHCESHEEREGQGRRGQRQWQGV